MTAAEPPTMAATPDIDPVLALIRERLGLRTSGPAAARMRAGIRRLMGAVGAVDGEQLVALLEDDPAAFDRLVDEVTVPETYFARGRDQLTELRGRVLPELRLTRGPAHALRVWSAGCATGEEAYTLALLLDEVDGGRPSAVLATDVSTTALESARSGTYRRASLRRADDATRRVLEPAGDGSLRVPAHIAERVEFARLNLVTDPYPPGAFDLILCRNVLVYLTEAERARVARRLAASLAPGGWLLSASTDPTAGLDEHLEVVRTAAGVLYRRQDVGGPAIAASPPPSPSAAHGISADGAGGRGIRPPAGRERGARPTRAASDVPRGRHPVPAPSTETRMRVRELTAAGQLDDALTVVRDAITRHPFDADLRCLEGIVLLEAGHPEVAAAAARAATYVASGAPSGFLVLGRALLALGDRASARKAFSAARELLAEMPDDVPIPVFERSAGELLLSARTLVATTGGRAR